jgi:hypothetical protein
MINIKKKLTKNAVNITERSGEKFFLHGYNNGRKRRGFLNSEGICIVCGELFPLALEDEHIFGKEVSPFAITLCGSCHRIRHRVGWDNLLKLKGFFGSEVI